MLRNSDDVCVRLYQFGKDLERVYRCYLELRNLVIHGINNDLHDLKNMSQSHVSRACIYHLFTHEYQSDLSRLIRGGGYRNSSEANNRIIQREARVAQPQHSPRFISRERRRRSVSFPPRSARRQEREEIQMAELTNNIRRNYAPSRRIPHLGFMQEMRRLREQRMRNELLQSIFSQLNTDRTGRKWNNHLLLLRANL